MNQTHINGGKRNTVHFHIYANHGKRVNLQFRSFLHLSLSLTGSDPISPSRISFSNLDLPSRHSLIGSLHLNFKVSNLPLSSTCRAHRFGPEIVVAVVSSRTASADYHNQFRPLQSNRRKVGLCFTLLRYLEI